MVFSQSNIFSRARFSETHIPPKPKPLEIVEDLYSFTLHTKLKYMNSNNSSS